MRPSNSLTPRGALLIAILVECLVLLAAWYLRIRSADRVLVLLGLHLPATGLYLWLFARYFRAVPDNRGWIPRDPWIMLIVIALIAVVPLGGFEQGRDLAGKLTFLAFIPVIALKEELFYRGILQGAMERQMHPMAAVLMANIAFIASHAPMMDINLLNGSIIGSAGLVFGVLYQVTRSMALVALLHVAVDWILVIPAPRILSHDAVIATNVIIAVAALAWWTRWAALRAQPRVDP